MSQDVTVNAVVLRRRDAGESDRRLTLLTRELGKVDVVARGARKPSSRFAAASEPLFSGKLSFTRSKKSRYLSQAQPIGLLKNLRGDFDRLQLSLSFLELVEAVSPYDLEDAQMFDLLLEGLVLLDGFPNPLSAAVHIQLRLMQSAGFLPQFAECPHTGHKLAGSMSWFSPTAGGVLGPGIHVRFEDAFEVDSRVLKTLDLCSGLTAPSERLNLATPCIALLYRCWVNFAEMQLPATLAVVNHLAS